MQADGNANLLAIAKAHNVIFHLGALAVALRRCCLTCYLLKKRSEAINTASGERRSPIHHRHWETYFDNHRLTNIRLICCKLFHN